MPRQKNSDLQKHTLNLRAGDFERLAQLFPDPGAGIMIRTIVSRFVDKCEAKSEQPNVKVDI